MTFREIKIYLEVEPSHLCIEMNSWVIEALCHSGNLMCIVISEKLLDIFTCVKRLSCVKTEFPSIKFIDLNLLCGDILPQSQIKRMKWLNALEKSLLTYVGDRQDNGNRIIPIMNLKAQKIHFCLKMINISQANLEYLRMMHPLVIQGS